MRKGYVFAALAALGLIGLAGWATLGSAQPVFDPSPGKTDDLPRAKSPPSDPPALIPDIGNPPIGKPRKEVPPQRIDIQPVKPQILIIEPIGLPKPAEPKPVVPKTEPGDAPLVIEPIETTKSGEPKRLAMPPLKSVDPSIKSPDGDLIQVPIRQPAPEAAAGNGKSEPSVTLEWVGPAALKVGMPAEYTLAVRNTCNLPLQKVVVQARMPAGVTLLSTDPKPDATESVLLWELGTLTAQQERRIALRMTAPQRGEVACQAWVTFTGVSVMKLRVREPKLQVKMQAPEKMLVGDPTNIVLTVSNPGDHPADHVKVTATLGEGLESVRGNKVMFEIGALAAGETRTVNIPCVGKVGGAQKCEVVAEGDGLKAGDTVSLNVIQPRLDLAMTGPKMRYEGKKAVYAFKVTNPGDAPAANVFITQLVPSGFKFVQADANGQHDESSRSVKWFVGELGAGESREVKVELLATSQGEFTHKVVAHSARGMKAEQELKTVVEGISAISMEVVDTDDPVEVGADTSYEIRIANTGTKAESDVKLVCAIPPQMKLKSVTGPARYEMVGNDVVFQSLPRLAPRADAVFKVTVTAVAKGDARFKTSLTTASLVEPVTKVEVTKVYAE